MNIPLLAQAKKNYGFTEDRPCIIASDWDFQPYEFVNNEGKPSGYNIEVMEMILSRLQIPHKFMMQEWYLATEMFARREADLIHALPYEYTTPSFFKTKNYINYYTVRLARKLDTPPLRSIKDLHEGDTLLLKKDDYVPLRIQRELAPSFTVEYLSPKDGLTSIRRGQQKYYIWGEIALGKKIRELALDSVILQEIDIPAGDLHIIGYNKELINDIDDEYARLEQAGEIKRIYDKWFHPERLKKDSSPYVLLVLGIIAIAGLIALLMSRLITLRVWRAVRKSTEVNNIMTQALSMGDYFVLKYDLDGNMLYNIYGDMLPKEGLLPQEFLKRMPPEQAAHLHELNMKLATGQQQHFDMHLSFDNGYEGESRWREYYGNGQVELGDNQERTIIYTIKDITQEVEQERENCELGNKYRQVFKTNLLAMSYYDKDGRLIDLNDKMRELCGLNGQDPKREQYFMETNLFDSTFFKNDYHSGTREVFHCCLHLSIPEINEDTFIESNVRPVLDHKGRPTCYIVTSRDVTDERNMYLEQQRHDRELTAIHEKSNDYEQKLHYLLKECHMFIWHYNPATNNISLSRSLKDEAYEESLTDFFAGIYEEEREEALQNAIDVITNRRPYQAIHHFQYTPLEDHDTWYAISGIPTFDKEGHLIEFFGIARNINELMTAQQRLKQETARAEDSGRLKAAFLANMTHEIRTPLNAIVGFSDILQMVETPEERMEFIRIIRTNCDMLLRLINDILEASTMGQSLTIRPEQLDLAQVFNDICLSLSQRVEEAGVTFIKDNPYSSYPAYIDRGRLQQVLTNFVTNAVKYTHEGHIRVGYREEDDGLLFYCEDTGTGIPADKQAAIFDRFVKLNDFVQGTGLGLSICKSICERCGGHIGVHSEGEGYGSTFWMWIPRQVILYQTIRSIQ
jgi:signal transduction histidine kinase